MCIVGQNRLSTVGQYLMVSKQRRKDIEVGFLRGSKMVKLMNHRRVVPKKNEVPVSLETSLCYLEIIFAFIAVNSSSVINPCFFKSASSFNSSIEDLVVAFPE